MAFFKTFKPKYAFYEHRINVYIYIYIYIINIYVKIFMSLYTVVKVFQQR